MAYYPPEVIKRAKQMDLLTYLKNYEPDELVHFSRDTYMTRTHDSLKISNGMWYWFSQSIGGKSAIDYLMKVRDYTFLQAVETIVGSVVAAPPKIYKTVKKTIPDRLMLPKKAPNNDRVKSYLMGRGIDEDIITNYQNGTTPDIKIATALTDPNTGKTEQYMLTGVQFTEVAVAEWESKKLVTRSMPFTFTSCEILSTISD